MLNEGQSATDNPTPAPGNAPAAATEQTPLGKLFAESKKADGVESPFNGIIGYTDDDEPEVGDGVEPKPAAKPEAKADDKPKADATPVDVTLDDEDYSIASEMGITREQLDAAGDAAPDMIIAGLDRKMVEIGKQIQAERAGKPAAPPQNQPASAAAKPQPKPAAPQQPEPEASADDFAFPDDFNETNYEPSLVKSIKGAHAALQARLKKLEERDAAVGEKIEQFDRLSQTISAAQVRENERMFYSLVTGLGDEGKSVFGDVSNSRPKPGTPEHQKLEALAVSMEAIMLADESLGSPPRTPEQLARAAFIVNHPEILTQRAEKSLREKQAARSGAAVPRGVNGRYQASATQQDKPRPRATVAATVDGMPE